ncbi:CcmD family protein [Shewanella indica]|uniref:CcmD family protein n=1 Tax=Shewanella indica TaxID=768528 RepID=UPI00313F2BD9
MNKLKIIALLLLNSFLCITVTAQETGGEGLMRSNGKIFVVMAVVVTILIGLFIYIATVDRKITRLEKEK